MTCRLRRRPSGLQRPPRPRPLRWQPKRQRPKRSDRVLCLTRGEPGVFGLVMSGYMHGVCQRRSADCRPCVLAQCTHQPVGWHVTVKYEASTRSRSFWTVKCTSGGGAQKHKCAQTSTKGGTGPRCTSNPDHTCVLDSGVKLTPPAHLQACDGGWGRQHICHGSPTAPRKRRPTAHC